MKKQIYLTTSLILILFISSCKKCSDSNGNTYNVNQEELPFIIPYNDTSKVRFLKNGTDTLTFASQGLKQTYISQNVPDDGCSHTDKLQQFSLKMKCNDKEFFEITNNPIHSEPNATININNVIFNNIYLWRNNLRAYDYTTNIDRIDILNTSYDSLTKISLKDTTTYFIFKGKIGILKIAVNNNIYEILK
jgi:hypothetical protein